MSYFPRTSAELNAAYKPAAIVQPARKNCAEWKKHIAELAMKVTHDAQAYRQGVKQFKDSEDWKYEYDNWGDASREVLGITPQRSNQLCRELIEYYEDDLGKGLSEVDDSNNKKTESKQAQPKPVELPAWANKILKLFQYPPKSKLYNKLSPEAIKAYESAVVSLSSVLANCIPVKPAKVLCRCGCGLSAKVSEELFKVGVPCKGLTPGEAGLIMGRLAANEWKLPRDFEWARNQGEWVERKFKGKPAPKTP